MTPAVFLVVALALPANQNQLARLKRYMVQTHATYDLALGDSPGPEWKKMPFLWEGFWIWSRIRRSA